MSIPDLSLKAAMDKIIATTPTSSEIWFRELCKVSDELEAMYLKMCRDPSSAELDTEIPDFI